MFQWWPTWIQDGVYFITLWLAPLECLTLKHGYRHRNCAPIFSRTRDNVENLFWIAAILKSRMAVDKRKFQPGKLPIMILEIRRNILVPLASFATKACITEQQTQRKKKHIAKMRSPNLTTMKQWVCSTASSSAETAFHVCVRKERVIYRPNGIVKIHRRSCCAVLLI